MRYPSGVTDQYLYFVAVDATDLKTRETGLNTFTVYRSRNGGVAAPFTTPTINETDSVNMPGVYELLLDEDMTIDAGDDSQEMVFHITHAGMAPVTRTIELYRRTVSAGMTLGVDASGRCDLGWWLGAAVTKSAGNKPNVNVAEIGEDSTAANNLETAALAYTATRGLAGSALPDAIAGAKGGLPITDASTGLTLTGFGGAILIVDAQATKTPGHTYVATTGNDANDGTSWYRAKLSPKTAIEAAGTYSLVEIAPGNYNLGSPTVQSLGRGMHILVPQEGITVRGHGQQCTRIISGIYDETGSEAFYATVIQPANGTTLSGLTVEATAANGTAISAVGIIEVPAAAIHRVDLEDMYLLADDLAFVAIAGAFSKGDLVRIRHSVLKGHCDSVECYIDNLTFHLVDSDVLALGPASVGNGQTYGLGAMYPHSTIFMDGGLLYSSNTSVLAKFTASCIVGSSDPIWGDATGGQITLRGVSVRSWAAAGSVYDISCPVGTGVITTNGADYDPDKVTGNYFDGTNEITKPSVGDFRATRSDLVDAPNATAVAAMADAVCDEALAGHTTAGTVGKAITDILEDTGTTLPALIGTEAGTAAEIWSYASRVLTSDGTVMITSPVTTDLDIEIVQYSDYSATCTPPLDWSNSAGDWLAGNIAGATVTLTIKDRAGTTILTKAGTVVTATGTQAVRVTLTQANTAVFTSPGRQYTYQLHLTTLTEQCMVASGDVIVTPSIDLVT